MSGQKPLMHVMLSLALVVVGGVKTTEVQGQEGYVPVQPSITVALFADF